MSQPVAPLTPAQSLAAAQGHLQRLSQLKQFTAVHDVLTSHGWKVDGAASVLYDLHPAAGSGTEAPAYLVATGEVTPVKTVLKSVGNYNPKYGNLERAKQVLMLTSPDRCPVFRIAYPHQVTHLHGLESNVCSGPSSNFFIVDRTRALLRFTMPVFEKKGGDGPVMQNELYQVPTNLKKDFAKVIKDYDVHLMTVYDINGRLVPYQDLDRVLVGAIVEVTFKFIHYAIPKDGSVVDSLTGEIVQVVVLREPVPHAANNFTRNRPFCPLPSLHLAATPPASAAALLQAVLSSVPAVAAPGPAIPFAPHLQPHDSPYGTHPWVFAAVGPRPSGLPLSGSAAAALAQPTAHSSFAHPPLAHNQPLSHPAAHSQTPGPSHAAPTAPMGNAPVAYPTPPSLADNPSLQISGPAHTLAPAAPPSSFGPVQAVPGPSHAAPTAPMGNTPAAYPTQPSLTHNPPPQISGPAHAPAPAAPPSSFAPVQATLAPIQAAAPTQLLARSQATPHTHAVTHTPPADVTGPPTAASITFTEPTGPVGRLSPPSLSGSPASSSVSSDAPSDTVPGSVAASIFDRPVSPYKLQGRTLSAAQHAAYFPGGGPSERDFSMLLHQDPNRPVNWDDVSPYQGRDLDGYEADGFVVDDEAEESSVDDSDADDEVDDWVRPQAKGRGKRRAQPLSRLSKKSRRVSSDDD
ncbi:hypothetical protein C8J57DRAFT_1492373 [Mycena rebaudengoi]|nr:hypothetical protein C8J57DRAFT_1492373 [Mycena rebaudengoi]